MELPVRIVDETPRDAVISVDGAFAGAGLNLSHWPGHRTPPALRHDLSTGAALLFARLDPARRRELAGEARAIVNNHYDTDGTCALYAVRYPQQALEFADGLLDAARAGDMFASPSELAFQIDVIVAAMADVERSPIASELRGLDDAERYTRATHRMFEVLPSLLRGEVEPYRELWFPPLERWRADLDELGRASRDDLVHLDCTMWSATAGSFAANEGPGRHALFGSTPHDRVLIALPGAEGTRYRFVINTYSWFELVTRATLPRPDLTRLAAALNALEGTSNDSEIAWRNQSSATPSPELWFGTAQHGMFAEHCAALRPSVLPLARVRRALVDAQRDALVLPD